MAKNKGARIIITLRCVGCKNAGNINSKTQITGDQKKRSREIDYTTTKNRRNTPDRLEIKKYCPNCNIHAPYKEIK